MIRWWRWRMNEWWFNNWIRGLGNTVFRMCHLIEGIYENFPAVSLLNIKMERVP